MGPREGEAHLWPNLEENPKNKTNTHAHELRAHSGPKRKGPMNPKRGNKRKERERDDNWPP